MPWPGQALSSSLAVNQLTEIVNYVSNRQINLECGTFVLGLREAAKKQVSAMSFTIPKFNPDESARLMTIWDRLYELYLEKANGDREPSVIQQEINHLIAERDAIRSWGWSTGRNWRDDIPPEIVEKLQRE